MGPIFEGDGWFCVIAIIVSELLADIPWLSAQMRLPGIVMISLIFALFYGPEPKRISKKFSREEQWVLWLLRCLENWSEILLEKVFELFCWEIKAK